TPCTASASARASADLPLAVGPAISTALSLLVVWFMTHVATLISPTFAALDDGAARIAQGVLGANAGPQWLDPGIAADIFFDAAPAAESRPAAERVRGALAGRPIDVGVQPVAHRRKRLFLADMDSTMIEQECIDELADFVGQKAHVAAITD